MEGRAGFSVAAHASNVQEQGRRWRNLALYELQTQCHDLRPFRSLGAPEWLPLLHSALVRMNITGFPRKLGHTSESDPVIYVGIWFRQCRRFVPELACTLLRVTARVRLQKPPASQRDADPA